MTCAKDSLFTQAVNSMIAKGDLQASQSVIIRDKSKSLQQGGIQEWIIPSLAALSPGTATQVRYESSGISLYLAKSGTAPGAEFTVEFAGGKSLTKVVPGTLIKGSFEGFNLTNTGVAVGSARWVICQLDGVEYNEEFIELLGAVATTSTAISSAYNSSANTNAPSGAPAALGAANIRGASAVHALITSSSAILTCTVRWWFYDDTLATWYASPTIETITGVAGGSVNIVTSDLAVGVKSGWVYPEIYANTNSGGSGAFSARIQVI